MVVKTKPATAKAKPATAKAKPEAAATQTEPVEKIEPVVADTKPAREEKPKKQKMVRDSFTMPQDEYAQIAALKARCLKAGVGVKKSELLRAALGNLASLADKELLLALDGLKKIKTGRPAKA
jgi:hypothetical protein